MEEQAKYKPRKVRTTVEAVNESAGDGRAEGIYKRMEAILSELSRLEQTPAVAHTVTELESLMTTFKVTILEE